MQPGSFIDLLMRAKDKTTGEGFTDLEIANQVTPFSPYPRASVFSQSSPSPQTRWPYRDDNMLLQR